MFKDLIVGYSTLPSRLRSIHFLPNVSSLVIIQNPDSEVIPELDVQVRTVELNSIGVAKSRNAAIDNAQSKYLLFADDDIEFVPEGVSKIIDYLEANPNISIALCQTVNEAGELRKNYPNKARRLKLRNSAKAATYEMFIRVEDIKRAGIRFDENFGAGVANYLGDEYIFIADALRSGLKGVFLPVVVAKHPALSSGSFQDSSIDRVARGRVFQRVFGFWAPVARLLFLVKPPFRKLGLVNSILFIFGR